MFAFIVLDLVFSVQCQETGWEECLQSDSFCVEWDIKPVTQYSVLLIACGDTV